jgi:hypothetical protein
MQDCRCKHLYFENIYDGDTMYCHINKVWKDVNIQCHKCPSFLSHDDFQNANRFTKRNEKFRKELRRTI